MNERNYAAKLTKEELIKSGITDITKDGKVFRGTYEVKLSKTRAGYLCFNIYKFDNDGNYIQVPVIHKYKTASGEVRYSQSYNWQVRAVGLHRAMWAWFNNIVPDGYVVDHINNKHDDIEDYRLENLQLLTPAENLSKEKDEPTKIVKCKLNKPLSFYENKLNEYTKRYEEAKKEHNAKLVANLRQNMSNARGKIRYWRANNETKR